MNVILKIFSSLWQNPVRYRCMIAKHRDAVSFSIINYSSMWFSILDIDKVVFPRFSRRCSNFVLSRLFFPLSFSFLLAFPQGFLGFLLYNDWWLRFLLFVLTSIKMFSHFFSRFFPLIPVFFNIYVNQVKCENFL